MTRKKKRISLHEVQKYVSSPLRTFPSFCITGWLKFKQKVILFWIEVSEESLELPEQHKIAEGSLEKRQLWKESLNSLAESELYMHGVTPRTWKKAELKISKS